MTPNRSLIPATRAVPVLQGTLPVVLTQRLLPAAGRAIATAIVGLTAEYALRSLTNRALASVVRPSKRNPPGATLTVITEFVVIERLRQL